MKTHYGGPSYIEVGRDNKGLFYDIFRPNLGQRPRDIKEYEEKTLRESYKERFEKGETLKLYRIEIDNANGQLSLIEVLIK